MKKLIALFKETPALFFIIAALVWGGFLYGRHTSKFHDPEFQENLLVEASGLVFDLFVFGLVLSLYEGWRAKRERIKRLHEEIDDFRGWDEKEASHRIVGTIRRLLREGVTEFDLHGCNIRSADVKLVSLVSKSLRGADLKGSDLSNATLERANLEMANLKMTKLAHVLMNDANMKGVNLESADLQSANLSRAVLQMANLSFTNLKNTNLNGANLTNADLSNANLQNTLLCYATLEGANLCEANLYKAFFQMADLRSTNLRDTNLYLVDLTGAKLENAYIGGEYSFDSWVEKLKEWRVLGRESIIDNYILDNKGFLRIKNS